MTDSLRDRIVQKDMPIHLCRTDIFPALEGGEDVNNSYSGNI